MKEHFKQEQQEQRQGKNGEGWTEHVLEKKSVLFGWKEVEIR